MATWLTSDPHYGHNNIITYSKRPFRNTDEMGRELIARHNAVVGKDDTTINVGDFSMSERFVPEILKELNGNHILVPGNHDKCHPKYGHKAEAAKRRYIQYGFSEVNLEMRLGPFLVSHMPYSGDHSEKDRYSEYRPKDEGSWLLHGHIHTMWKVNGRQINVGVDVWDYTPVRLETLLEIAK